MINIKTIKGTEFVKVTAEDGSEIPCEELVLWWDPERKGMVARLQVAFPNIDLDIEKNNYKIVGRGVE